MTVSFGSGLTAAGRIGQNSAYRRGQPPPFGVASLSSPHRSSGTAALSGGVKMEKAATRFGGGQNPFSPGSAGKEGLTGRLEDRRGEALRNCPGVAAAVQVPALVPEADLPVRLEEALAAPTAVPAPAAG